MHLNRINLIIIICIIASLLYWYTERTEWATEYFAFSGENLLKGRVWTLVSALFLHADPMHLFGNMVFLFVFGNTLERELKTQKTLSAFFSGGIITLLLGSFFYEPSTFLIGASAAIFTLTAIVMLIKPLKFSFLFLMPQGLVAIIYFTYNLFAVYFSIQGNIAYISHVIGFLIGIPLGIAWGEEWIKNLLITIGLFFIYIFFLIVLIPFFIQMLL
ncbi:MAG: rhomboid family intramembrane serine protease [Candidatus Bathyarchaeota archaeon]|nr:MAG: rhomboid family intramembrane serine protease [Candidatus Bathyarchaeota archaeon]